MARVYAILYDDSHIYVPIKADTYPNGAPADYRTMPVFFGGRIDTGETESTQLKKEIREESQGNYELPDAFSITDNNVEQIVYDNPLAGYSFYKINIATAGDLKTRNAVYTNDVCALLKPGATNKEKEHGCILKVPKTSVTGGDVNARVLSFVASCGTKSYTKYGGTVRACCSDAGGAVQFNGSQTKKAYEKFFENYHA